ncbi:MAG TPA: HD domain-containing protein [Bacteroidales bacterium]|nr:HD domain-containing protein [Bacteroidales bacterium]HRZ75834.1 HD domain-containing protein [Bacteroidales bacterium]
MQVKSAIEHILSLMEREFPEGLLYHEIGHTLDVIRAAERICRMECEQPHSLDLIRTAAAFHDAGFIYAYDGHELHSVRMAEQTLPAYGYAQDDILRITGAITATMAGEHPRDRLSQVLCDADLDYLGREDFLTVSTRLRLEWALRGTEYPDRAWLQFQLEYLRAHRYHTPSARILREPGKATNMRRLNALLQSITD